MDRATILDRTIASVETREAQEEPRRREDKTERSEGFLEAVLLSRFVVAFLVIVA